MRVGEAKIDSLSGILVYVLTVHRLQEEVVEREILVSMGLGAFLRKHELQFVAASEHQWRVRLWTHADPVQAGGRLQGAVRLHGHGEPAAMQRGDRRRVEL